MTCRLVMLLITLGTGYQSIFAQQLEAGLMAGIYETSGVSVNTGDVVLIAQEASGKFLTPGIRGSLEIRERWTLSSGMSYRKKTISFSAWDPAADTCSLCPLVKGGGPTASELRYDLQLYYELTRGKNVNVYLGAGAGVAFRFAPKSNVTSLPESIVRAALESLTTLYQNVPVLLSAGIRTSVRRWNILASIEACPRYTTDFTFKNRKYPFNIKESRMFLSLTYTILGKSP